MIPDGALVLLDTNVLVYLVRQNEIGKRIAAEHRLSARAERPLISIVTVGESRSLTRKFNWGASKRDSLSKLLRELVIVDISSQQVLEQYAEIVTFARRRSEAQAIRRRRLARP